MSASNLNPVDSNPLNGMNTWEIFCDHPATPYILFAGVLTTTYSAINTDFCRNSIPFCDRAQNWIEKYENSSGYQQFKKTFPIIRFA